MWLMVTFSGQLTTLSLYKLAIHRTIFYPILHHQITDTTPMMSHATCNHDHLGTWSIYLLNRTTIIQTQSSFFSMQKSRESMVHKLTWPWPGACECHEVICNLLSWHNLTNDQSKLLKLTHSCSGIVTAMTMKWDTRMETTNLKL